MIPPRISALGYKIFRWKEIDREFWQWQRELDLPRYIDPINAAECREEFERSLRTPNATSPVFRYRQPEFDPRQEISRCREFQDRISRSIPLRTLAESYTKVLGQVQSLLQIIRERAADRPVAEALTQIHGCPPPSLLDRAKEILLTPVHSHEQQRTLSCTDLAAEFEKSIEDLGLDWTIRIEPHMSANMATDALKREIKIRKGANFSKEEAARLKAHEIGVHVLRAENGSRQPFRIFEFGFADYLSAEEGLAAYAEEKTGHLSSWRLGVYAARALASHLTTESSFSEVFHAISSYLPFEEAYAITERVKRGLIDTSQPGGYTKDRCYLGGLQRIENLPHRETISLLFCGKIGFSELDMVREMEITQQIQPPAALPDWCES